VSVCICLSCFCVRACMCVVLRMCVFVGGCDVVQIYIM